MNKKQSSVSQQTGQQGADKGRRSFIWKSGAAFSAAIASAAAGMGKAGAAEASLQQQVDKLAGRLEFADDCNCIRELQESYGYYLEKGEYREIINLFADNGEVHFNGGVFAGREDGLRRLYVERFGGGISGGQTGPVHGRLREQAGQQDSITIAPDRRTATASFHCYTQVAEAEDTNAPFLEMARLQGQGIRRWWEAGVYENTYVRDGNNWKIKRLVYHTLGQADKEEVS